MNHIDEYHRRNSDMFNKLFPELEDIEIFYYDRRGPGDSGIKNVMPMPKQGVMDGRYIQCSKDNCTGKHDLFPLIKSAIRKNIVETKPESLFCSGNLLSPKKTKSYGDCRKSISITMKLIYRKDD